MKNFLCLSRILACALAFTPAFAADPTWSNHSDKTWTVVVNGVGKGKISVRPYFDPKAEPVILKKEGDTLTMPPKSIWTCQYLDAEDTLFSRKEERLHAMSFSLVGPDKRPIKLESYRKVSPGSNVWVGCTLRAMWDTEELNSRLGFGEVVPGDITLYPGAVAAPQSLIPVD